MFRGFAAIMSSILRGTKGLAVLFTCADVFFCFCFACQMLSVLILCLIVSFCFGFVPSEIVLRPMTSFCVDANEKRFVLVAKIVGVSFTLWNMQKCPFQNPESQINGGGFLNGMLRYAEKINWKTYKELRIYWVNLFFLLADLFWMAKYCFRR